MNWLTVKNIHEDGKQRKAELWVDGVVGFKDWLDDSGVTATEFIKTTNALGDLTDIDLFINSPGGVVSDGVSITNYLINHSASVSVTVMGQAASIASVIAQAADPGKLHMALGSTMFVHDPLTVIGGDADDLREAANTLDKIRDSIIPIYQRRSILSTDEIVQLLKNDTTMTAEDAVKNGFADSMDETLEAVAIQDLEPVFEAAKQAYKNNQSTENRLNLAEEIKKILNQSDKNDLQNPHGAAAHNKGGLNMPEEKTPAASMPDITVEYLNTNHTQITNTLKAEGVVQERERIQAVLAQTLPGHEELINNLAFDGKTTGEQAAVAVLQAEKTNRSNYMQNIKDDATDLDDVSSSIDDFDVIDSNLPIETRCENAWNKSATLREEFTSFESYLAYEKNFEAGNARILGGKK